MPLSYTFTTPEGFQKTVTLEESTDDLLGTSDEIVAIIPAVLSDFMRLPNRKPSVFDSDFAEKVSLNSYFRRIRKYFQCSNEAYVLALIYLNRLTGFSINQSSVHKLFLTSLVVAAKFIDDEYLYNWAYAKVGFCSLKSLNELEDAFLELIHYNLHVKVKEFVKFRNYLLVTCYKVPLHKRSIPKKCKEIGDEDSTTQKAISI
eukprot:Platyproteum_vivax@DN2233_c0_g1_i1.p1